MTLPKPGRSVHEFRVSTAPCLPRAGRHGVVAPPDRSPQRASCRSPRAGTARKRRPIEATIAVFTNSAIAPILTVTNQLGATGRFRQTNGGPMIFIVSTVVVLAAVAGVCLVVLWRRGGSGESGALQRGAADQGLAQGLGTTPRA